MANIHIVIGTTKNIFIKNIYGIFFKVSGKFSESFREINYIASVMDVCGGHACTFHLF